MHQKEKNTKSTEHSTDYEHSDSYQYFNKWHWLLLLVFLCGSVFLVQMNARDFQAAVIPTTTAPAYNGTTLPVLKAPKWTSLSSSEWNLSYDQMPSDKMQALPVYDPLQLKTPSEQLGWQSASDLSIRNAKITFSVPYMGNYQLDGQENAGSHLAVDIKIPSNTPVYAIGNGVVSKVSEQNTGFGKHIVVKHDNFPSYDNPSVKTTYYSSYSHLGQVLVAENSVVTKGQLIGKSGTSGTSTTPHLHFQIDNAKAPWHPYWPFTFQESSDAGLSFSGAVNAGLGKDKALETTVNPMKYVQKYLDGNSTSSSSDSGSTSSSNDSSSTSELPPALDDASTDNSSNNDTNVGNDTTVVVETEPGIVVPPSTPAAAFEIVVDEFMTKGVATMITVKALDKNGDIAVDYKPEDKIYIDVLLGAADVVDSLDENDFKDGVAKFLVTPTSDSPLMIKVTDGTISAESKALKSISFTDLEEGSDYYEPVSFLKNNEVISGYPDGTFKPNNVVSRVEALKFILNGINSDLISSRELPFPDTLPREWYSDYVATAYNRSIVNGYPDNSFKPANTVNRAEFLKMLLISMDINVSKNVDRDVYSDVPKEAWFAPYAQYAKEKNLIVLKNKQFRPDDGMTRGEVASLIYKVIMLKISGAEKYSSGIKVTDSNIRNFFS